MPNKVGSYMNLKGTTFSSFKMGKKGVELYSAAKVGKTDIPGLFYKTSKDDEQTGKEKEKEIQSLEKDGFDIPDYDIAIPSKNIKRLYASKGIGGQVDTLTIVLTNGQSFSISKEIKAEELFLPQDAADGEVAVYSKDDETGIVSMGRSGMSITNEISNNDSNEDSEIPTVSAIRSHITGVSEILNTRSNGNNVTKI